MVLSGSQAHAIQGNWKKVRAHEQDLANDLFLRYLSANPGDQALFPKFANVALGDLRGNAAFNEQTKTVFDALGNIVDHLGNIQEAAVFLRERVRTHYKRHISMAQFERLLDLLPMFLQEKAHASGEVADAWRIAISDLMPAMRDEFSRQ
jgi:hemoglobin-like flavoprotein